MSVQYKTEDGWKNISTSSNNAVDSVTDGNMNPVTSNAVYDALNTITTGTLVNDEDCIIKYAKVGILYILTIYTKGAYTGSKALGITLKNPGEGIKTAMNWSGVYYGEAYINDSGTQLSINVSGQSSGQIVCFAS